MFAIAIVLLVLEAIVALGFNAFRHKFPKRAKAFMPAARIVIVLVFLLDAVLLNSAMRNAPTSSARDTLSGVFVGCLFLFSTLMNDKRTTRRRQNYDPAQQQLPDPSSSHPLDPVQ